jgi:membrane associated rhomboid family serine protease
VSDTDDREGSGEQPEEPQSPEAAATLTTPEAANEGAIAAPQAVNEGASLALAAPPGSTMGVIVKPEARDEGETSRLFVSGPAVPAPPPSQGIYRKPGRPEVEASEPAAFPAPARLIHTGYSSRSFGSQQMSIATVSARSALVPATAPFPRHEPEQQDENDLFPGLMALGPVPTERKARDWALVLQAMSIWHALRRSSMGWMVLVREADYRKAQHSIDHYEAENRDWPPREVKERPRFRTSPVIPLMFAALIAFYFVTGPARLESTWFTRGTAVADLVLTHQPWRAVTALTLHADSVHVLGNVISGSVFGSALHRRLGAGATALGIVASGAVGNLLNAVWHHSINGQEHASIGASTAVFGAVGLLAATQLVLDRPIKKQRSWTDFAGPIVGGLALLGALGSGGEHTDLGAHFFGLLAGFGLGLAASLPLRKTSLALEHGSRYAVPSVSLGAGAPRGWVQVVLGATAMSIIVASWQLAFR